MAITVQDTKLKPGYKQTEVGVIPDDWEPTPLGLISAFITKGATPTTYGFNWVIEGVLFLRSECVSEQGLDLTQSMFITPEAHNILKRGEVRAGDILITITGNVGRVIYLSDDFGIANINQHIARIRIIDINVSADYVFHFLSQSTIRKYYGSIITGQAYPQISLKQVRETRVPIPPTKAEQRAIAAALSDVDALIASLDKLITKKRDIKQATMQQLLTGKTRLPGFVKELKPSYKQTEVVIIPDDWDVLPLGKLATSISSGKSKAKSAQGTYPVHGSTGVIGYTESAEYDGEAILVARVGANAGKLNFVTGRYGVTDNTIIVKFKADSWVPYFRQQLGTKRLNSLVFGSGQPLITGTQLKGLLLCIPPSEEQKAIANVLYDMDAEIAALERKRDKIRSLKQGMMQELLTGKTRLI